MSFDLPDNEVYIWNDATFGAATVNHYIVGPRGKVGFVRDIEVEVDVALVGTTTVPEVNVGIATGDFTYGRYRLGSTAILGYGVGAFKASNELIVGNPPRVATDFAGHVVLDGGPLFSSGISGGSFGTQLSQGRIAASGRPVINAVNGTGNVTRVFLRDPLDPQIVVGQLVNVRGLAGVTQTVVSPNIGTTFAYNVAISALSSSATNPANPNWIELTGTTFGGTYTGGGLVDIVTVVGNKAGVGGTPAGGGVVKVKIEWVGPTNP
jgi:hypothetical protein